MLILLSRLVINLPETLGFKLTVMHYNDFHTRFEPIDRDGRDCSPEENERSQCFGGFARLKSKVCSTSCGFWRNKEL